MTALVTVTPLAPVDFDYTPLDSADADYARSTAERIRERTRASYIENGRDLIAVKARLEHGVFGKWLKAEFGWAERTAQNMMAAVGLVDKSAIVADLPVTTINLLAAPSTPGGTRDAIVARIENGETLSVKEIKSEIDRGKEQQAADLREQQRQAHLAKMACGELRKEEKKEKNRRRSREQKEKLRLQEQEKLRRLQIEQDRAADEIVALLTERFGDDLPKLLELLSKTSWYKVQDRLKSA